jgi:hypothetical protein
MPQRKSRNSQSDTAWTRRATGGLSVLAIAILVFGSAPAAAAGPQVPVALAWGGDGLLRVALRDGGAVVAIDPHSWTVVSRRELPIRPASIAGAPDEDVFLLGGMDGHVVVLDAGGKVVRDLALGRGPTRVLALPGGRAAVAACWDPVLRVLDWHEGKVVHEHPLGFAPGALARRPDGRIIVADAFGGRLCDLAPGAPGSERHCAIEGTGLHALAIPADGKELLFACMFQEDALPITTANIDAGRIISAQLGAIRLADLGGDRDRRDGADPPPQRRLTLDGPVHGAADPSAMALSRDGSKVVIALAGAHQIVWSDRTEGAGRVGADDLLPLGHNQRLRVVEVGRSPMAVTLVEEQDPTGMLAVTADAMSDTLTVIRLSDRARVAAVDLGPRSQPQAVLTAAQRGEAIFRDGRRSHDRWMSCATCHPAGHTTGLNFDTFGDSGFGAPKNTPTLLGVAGTAPFTWTAQFDQLAGQVHQSFQSSLLGPEPGPGVVEDLVAYLESLPPAPPRRRGDDPAVVRGASVFTARRC